MKHITYKILFLLGITTMFFESCKKFVEVPLPIDQLTSTFVFSNDNAAVSAITGIYSEMMNNQQQFSSGFTTLFASMSADDLYYYTPGFRDEFVTNQISVANHTNLEAFFWNPCYRYIYAANKCIEGVISSEDLSQPIKTTVVGEAKFIRAFCYFYLTNLFGDVPLVLSTDYQENQKLPRIAKSVVYTYIINDLKDAQSALSAEYPSIERVRPNKFAATALLARVYLYISDWINAEAEADAVINSGSYSLDNDINETFLINSNETIWQLQPVNPSRNTWEGSQIIPGSDASTPTYLLTNSLISAFEANDQRMASWVKSRVFSGQTLYYPYKYKVRVGSTLVEYYVVLRSAEQYLIRAEARAQQNNISGSLADLNVIRYRANLANSIATNQQELLIAIEHERQVEFFAEWGHRWFDLNRTKRSDVVLGNLKALTWQPTDTLWPIPQTQINLNPVFTQNSGY